MSQQSTISNALTAATARLTHTSTSSRIDAEVLLCHALGCNTAYLAAWPEKVLNPEQVQHYNRLVSQRESGTPVAYLTGKREFWSLELDITSDTLIPRPETESLVEFVLEKFDSQKQMQLVDLGTGSGAIAIALASERPKWAITATDISENALAVAIKNAGKHQIRNIDFRISRWFDAIKDQSFDIIISNPPYVAENDPHLSTGDVLFEPAGALASGITGMDDIETITGEAPQYLKDNGWLILEHGFDQKKLVFDCLKTTGFEPIIQISDLSNQPRITAGCFVSS